MVLDALKKRLHDAANSKGGKWIKVLWGKPQLSHTNNEGKQKLKNQYAEHRTKDSQKLFSR
jgi:hypothetical protein